MHKPLFWIGFVLFVAAVILFIWLQYNAFIIACFIGLALMIIGAALEKQKAMMAKVARAAKKKKAKPRKRKL